MRHMGQQCFVISPNSIPRASNDKVKTNRIDSKKLCELLKGGLLKPIRVPQGEYLELRHLVNIRKNYARKQKMAKQQIEGLIPRPNFGGGGGNRSRFVQNTCPYGSLGVCASETGSWRHATGGAGSIRRPQPQKYEE